MSRVWCRGLRSVARVILVSLLRRWRHDSVWADIRLHRRSLRAVRGVVLWLWLLARERAVCRARPHVVGGIVMLSIWVREHGRGVCHGSIWARRSVLKMRMRVRPHIATSGPVRLRRERARGERMATVSRR